MRERVKDKREAGEGRREGGKRRKKREGDREPGKRWGRTERAEGTLERITLGLQLPEHSPRGAPPTEVLIHPYGALFKALI